MTQLILLPVIKDKNGVITITVLTYCVLSIAYIAICPQSTMVIKPFFDIFRRVFYYLLQYGAFFVLSSILLTKINYSTDIFSLTVFKYYVLFKFIFFTFLINSDMPTYIKWMDSKVISISCSILMLIFTATLTILRK